MNDARRLAALTVANALFRSQHQNTFDQARLVLEALEHEGLVEFAPCACGTFSYHTNHHWDGCVRDEVIG